MRITIKIFGGKEYEKDIDQENYEALKEGLKSNEIGFIEVEGSLIKSSQIISIEPIGETIPKSFRLEQHKFEKVDMAGRMKELFSLLKSKGLFKDFASYEKFRKINNY